MTEADGNREQLQRDAHFLCSDRRMDSELVDRLVLQLNRIYPQILSDKEAQRFRTLSVPTKVRLPELLKHLHQKGEEACHDFYRGLHIHAEDVYAGLPSRVQRRDVSDAVKMHSERHTLNGRGPMFFLSCFSVVVVIAMFYYYGEVEMLRSSGPLLHGSAGRFGKGAKDVFISYADVGKQNT